MDLQDCVEKCFILPFKQIYPSPPRMLSFQQRSTLNVELGVYSLSVYVNVVSLGEKTLSA